MNWWVKMTTYYLTVRDKLSYTVIVTFSGNLWDHFKTMVQKRLFIRFFPSFNVHDGCQFRSRQH